MAINRGELPIWYGQRRGVSLAAFAQDDDGGDDQQDAGPAARLGYYLLALTLLIGSMAIALAAVHPAIYLLVPLTLAGAVCLIGGLYTAVIALTREEAPVWVNVIYEMLATIGKVIVWTFLIVSMIAIGSMIIGFIIAALSDD